MSQQKVKPEVGMKVMWINPIEDPANSRVIEGFIRRMGNDDLTIASIVESAVGPLVTLLKNSQPVLRTWDPDWGKEPENYKPQVSSYNWHYLRSK